MSDTDIEKTKLPWRQRISLTSYIIFIGITAVFIGTVTVSYYSYNLLVKSKFQDTWAISYLEMENQTRIIRDNILAFDQSINFNNNNSITYQKEPSHILLIQKGKGLRSIKGIIPKGTSLKKLGFHILKDNNSQFFVTLNGKSYLAKKDNFKDKYNYKIFLWPVNIFQSLSLSQHKNKDSSVYLANKQGSVIYSNRLNINSTNLASRPLVIKFIKNSLNKGQVHFTENGYDVNGFYSIVPNSNLVLFSEIPDDVILNKIITLSKKFMRLVALILLGTLVLLFLSLRTITTPIKELVENIGKVAHGHFYSLSLKAKSFGELNYLSSSFSEMVGALISRDHEIQQLLIQQKVKFRLEEDMRVAQEIQNNLLPKTNDPKDKDLKFNYYYQAADEVAGDWTGHYYNPETKETVIAIGDVSGHGAGSSMFTAVTAALFEEAKLKNNNFNAREFISNLNMTMKSLGQSKWHITIQVYVYNAKTHSLKILNAGHPFPFIYNESKKKTYTINMPSTPAGIKEDPKLFETEMILEQDTAFILYTDGLTESEDKNQNIFKPQKVRKIINNLKSTNPQRLMDTILLEWKEFTKDTKQNDDLCLVSFFIPGKPS